MTTLNQLLTLIEMAGLTGSAEVALRIGEKIVPMESCSFHEMNGSTALLIQGGRTNPTLETCEGCKKPLPPVSEWSMPHCPECVEKAESAANRGVDR